MRKTLAIATWILVGLIPLTLQGQTLTDSVAAITVQTVAPEVSHRSRISLGVRAGTFIYDGDYSNSAIRPMGEIVAGFFQNSMFSFDLGIGTGQLATRDYFSTIVQYSRLSAKYRLFSYYKYSPYIQLGGGFLLRIGDSDTFSQGSFGFLYGGLGFEFMPTQRFGIDVSAGYQWILNDMIDEMRHGKYNDYFWSVKLGVNFYLVKSKRVNAPVPMTWKKGQTTEGKPVN